MRRPQEPEVATASRANTARLGPAASRAKTARLGLAALCLALLLLLLGCAPTTAGSRANPFSLTEGGVSLRRGETVSVRLDLSLEEVGLEAGDFSAVAWVPGGIGRDIADASGMFNLTDVRLADGWVMRLVQVRVERIAVRSASTQEVQGVRYLVWALLDVTSAERAIPGTYRLRGTLAVRGGQNYPLSFSVESRP